MLIIRKKWSFFVQFLHQIQVILWTKRTQQSCKYFSQTYLSLNYLTISALQNLLFCVLKVAVLHGKSIGFASQKSRFRNVKAQLSLFKRIIFTKLSSETLTVSSKRLLKNACEIACLTCFLIPNQRIYIRCI